MIKKLLFVDTNIWLDFYRSRNDAGLTLLENVEAVADRVIVSFQLESEFKRNRLRVIAEGMQELKAPPQIQKPGLFSDAQATRMLNKSIKEAERHVKRLKARLTRVLDNPAAHDPVYQACQRIFHREDDLVLSRENKLRHQIRRRAFRRFLHGCPPRKPSDTSIGDAFNWEWMVHCAKESNAELVIVSRDSDYGTVFDNKVYVNDHLKQEFAERVSKKRKLLLYTRLSEALKHFEVPISQQAEAAETDIVSRRPSAPGVVDHRAPQLFVSWSDAPLSGDLGSEVITNSPRLPKGVIENFLKSLRANIVQGLAADAEPDDKRRS
jgi:hypothetical protein